MRKTKRSFLIFVCFAVYNTKLALKENISSLAEEKEKEEEEEKNAQIFDF